MNTKNIFFTLFMIFATIVKINCANDLTPQRLLRQGLCSNDYRTVKLALKLGANPNAIIKHRFFNERTCCNAYLATPQPNCNIVTCMFERGAIPTVDTDHILDQKSRNADLTLWLKRFIKTYRQQMFRREIDRSIKLVSRHTDPAAL